jgi:hypothetical protein
MLHQFGDLLYRDGRYAEGESLYRELVGQRRARLGAEHETVRSAKASLARLLTDWAWTERGSNQKSEIARRAQEAEHLLRDDLTMRLRGTAIAHLRTGEIRSRLGAALVAVAVTESTLAGEARVAKLTEAEALLLEGNEALEKGEKVESKYKRDSLTRLVRLYEAWDKPDELAGWRHKLADFDKVETETEPGEECVASNP